MQLRVRSAVLVAAALLAGGCSDVPTPSSDCPPDPESGARRYSDYARDTCVVPTSEEDARRLAAYGRLRGLSGSSETVVARLRFRSPIRATDLLALASSLPGAEVSAVSLRVSVGDEQWTVPLTVIPTATISDIGAGQLADTFLADATSAPLDADAVAATIRGGDYSIVSVVVRAAPARLLNLLETPGIVESIVPTGDEPWP